MKLYILILLILFSGMLHAEEGEFQFFTGGGFLPVYLWTNLLSCLAGTLGYIIRNLLRKLSAIDIWTFLGRRQSQILNLYPAGNSF